MKYILLLFSALVFFSSCKNNKKEKTNTTQATTETRTTGDDGKLTEWLKGKKLTADDPAKDYHNFKLNADGICEDKGGAKVSWTIEAGKLNMGGMLKIDIEKKDDTTLIMHRSLSDEIYKLSPL
jgi:hypothetical protein